MPYTTLQQLKDQVLKVPKAKAAYVNAPLDIKDVEVIFHPEKTETDSDERWSQKRTHGINP